MRRLRIILVASALAMGLAAGAPGAAKADNSAIAINTHDGSSVFRFAFAIRHVGGDVVDETNSAVAFASCTDCQTTAIAIEIVLMEGSPSTYTPINQAIAINYECQMCLTFAAAYQFVIQGTGPMHFTGAGYRDLERIAQAIRDLQKQNLSPFELRSALDPLIVNLKELLANELVAGPVGGPEPSQEGDQGPPPTAPPGADEQVGTGPAASATETGSGGSTGTVGTTGTTSPTTTQGTGSTTTEPTTSAATTTGTSTTEPTTTQGATATEPATTTSTATTTGATTTTGTSTAGATTTGTSTAGTTTTGTSTADTTTVGTTTTP
jgi:putative peptide zinc metalloprotease protein